jgi:hypothetical protein
MPSFGNDPLQSPSGSRGPAVDFPVVDGYTRIGLGSGGVERGVFGALSDLSCRSSARSFLPLQKASTARRFPAGADLHTVFGSGIDHCRDLDGSPDQL